MNDGPVPTDDAFFNALLKGDADGLEDVLGGDFTIVDVMRGGQADRATFIEAVSSGQVDFETIAPSERQVRRYGGTALIVGRTRMRGAFAGESFDVSSRYTHVFIRDGVQVWRLVSAQGTPILE